MAPCEHLQGAGFRGRRSLGARRNGQDAHAARRRTRARTDGAHGGAMRFIVCSCLERPPPRSPSLHTLYRRRRPNKKLGLAARAHSIRGPTYSREGSRHGSSPLAALAIYPGSFNPPSRMHVDIAKRVSELPGIGAVWLDMTSHVDEKSHVESFLADRVRMAELAVADLPAVGVVQLMSAMGDAGQTVAYFDELRRARRWRAARVGDGQRRCHRNGVVGRQGARAALAAAAASSSCSASTLRRTSRPPLRACCNTACFARRAYRGHRPRDPRRPVDRVGLILGDTPPPRRPPRPGAASGAAVCRRAAKAVGVVSRCGGVDRRETTVAF